MATNVDPPKKPCHNCRRQRLRCDRSYPRCNKCVLAGKECLGYGQLFRWTGAVASRGKFAGKTSLATGEDGDGAERFREESVPHSSSESWTLSSGASSPSGGANNLQLVHAMSAPADEIPGPWGLTDPLFQDLSYPYRYYLSYFTTRVCKDLVSYDLPDNNPFRALLPLTKAQPLLQHILVAVSAAHMSVLLRAPLPSSFRGDGKESYPSNEVTARIAANDSLVAKQKALQLMNYAVQNIETVGVDVVLAAALFFVNVELIESGKHGWRAHLEGAGLIMSLLPPNTAASESLRDYMLSDCFIYYVLGSAFSPPKSATFAHFSPDRLPTTLKRAAANSYLCCPPEILEILYAASQLSAAPEDDKATAEEAAALIKKAEEFDVQAWAEDLHRNSHFSNIPVESRVHTASAHRLAACLYASQAVPATAARLGDGAGERLSREVIQHLASVPDEDPNFKATAFPTFIAGAEAKDPETREWIMNRLRRLVFWCPWGFLYTAMETLQVIWQLEAEGKSQRGWIQTLKDPELNFLIV